MELPAKVKSKIERIWGEQGLNWINRFPEVLQSACERWRLSNVRPFSNLSYHFVASAQMGGREVVLKLGVPEREFFQEAAALEAFGGKACAELIDQAPDLAAMILERALPGESIESVWSEEKDDEYTSVLAETMKTLWRPAPDAGFPSLHDWAKALESGSENIPNSLLHRAYRMVLEFEQSASQAVLLHGDLHHGNVLRSGSGWKVIDPKGVVGDPSFEVYALLRNPVGASADFTLRRWERRLEIVAAITGLEKSRLLLGAFCGTMISCCWSVEESGEAPAADLELAQRLESAIC